MTNKLPKVGKRYREIDETSSEEIVVDSIINTSALCHYVYQPKSIFYASLTTFHQRFKELQNFQEKSEVELNKPIVSEVEKAKEQLRKG